MKKVSKNSIKKFVGVASVALMLGSGMTFVSCSDDSSDDSVIEVPNTDSSNNNNTDDNTNNSDNNNNNSDNNTNNSNNNSNSDNNNQNNNNNNSDDNNNNGDTPAETLFTAMTFDDVTVGDLKDSGFKSADGLFEIVAVGKNGAATVSESGAKSYNEDATYTKRIQMKGDALKLKVGANKNVILRVDGGSASGTGSERTISCGESKWTSFKGSADGKVAAGFLTVTGGEDGWVTLSADNNINVYGVKVVEAAEDLSSVVLGSSVSYGKVAIEGIGDNVKKDDSITLSASVSQTLTPLYANGLVGEPVDGDTLTDFAFYLDDEKLESETFTAPEGTHTVKAVLLVDGIDADGNPVKKEESKATGTAQFTAVDANATYYTVTFDAGEGTLEKNTVEVKEGETLTAEQIPTPKAPAGKSFVAWSAGTDAAITKDVTFTATYKEQTVYTLKAADITAIPENNIITVDGVSFTFCSGVTGSDGKLSGNVTLDSQKVDGDTKVNVLKTSGSLQTSKNWIKFTATGAGSVTIKYSGSKNDRAAKLATIENSKVVDIKTASNIATALKSETVTFNFDKAGDYYIGGTNGLYIVEVSVGM